MGRPKGYPKRYHGGRLEVNKGEIKKGDSFVSFSFYRELQSTMLGIEDMQYLIKGI